MQESSDNFENEVVKVPEPNKSSGFVGKLTIVLLQWLIAGVVFIKLMDAVDNNPDVGLIFTLSYFVSAGSSIILFPLLFLAINVIITILIFSLWGIFSQEKV